MAAASVVVVKLFFLAGAAATQGTSASPPPPPEPPIFITGTRIAAPNRKSASPVETVRPEDFTITGVANVEQTLNQLPQIVPSFTTSSNNPGTGAATLDLRGLGSVRTLVLVNGRRWIANDAGQTPDVDVNTIPATLIDRVDIVTGGASAVYGSDAVTGVINFVLKSKLQGLQLEARNNLTEKGDGRASSADLSYGTDFLGGRGRLIVSAGWLDQAPVLQGNRDYTAFTLADGCVIPGTETKFGASTPAPDPDLDCSDANEELGFLAGGSTFAPAGLFTGALFPGTGNQLLSRPARFTPDGSITTVDFSTDRYNAAPLNYLQVPLRRWSGHLFASAVLSEHFEPYTELSYVRTRSPQQLAPAGSGLGIGTGSVPRLRINLDNPFLSDQARQLLDTSFGVDAQGDRGFLGSNSAGFTVNPAFDGDADGIVRLPSVFRTRLSGLGPRQLDNKRDAYRILGGARGKLAGPFDYDLYFSTSRVRHDNHLRNSASAARLQQAMLARRDPASGQIVCLDPSGGCAPVNIFGVQDISPAAADFVRADPFLQTIIKQQVAEATVQGPLAEIPAGSLRTSLGAGWRRNSYRFEPDRTLEEGDNVGFEPSTGAAGETRVAEVFGEALVPVLRDKPVGQELSAELGFRYSHYDSVGGVWTWKAMANWAPIPALRFRGGLQKAVRAPNVRELFEEPTISAGSVADPCAPAAGLLENPEIAAACIRNGGVDLTPNQINFFPLVRTSGSTDLNAETARTLTLGAVARPLPNLVLTLDYYSIDIRDAIGTFGAGEQFIVFGCIVGQGGDPASPLCQAFERENGEITFVDLPTANLARLRARGIDWQLGYGFPLLAGDARLNLSGTRLISSTVQPNGGIEPIRCDGAFGGVCGATIAGTANPRWKLFNRFAWELKPVTLTFRHRYFSSTRNGLFAANEAVGTTVQEDQVPERARRLEARHYFDLAASVAIKRAFDFTIGVNNLTDRKPSLLGSDQVQANTDPSLYDVLGRRFFVAINARLF